VSLLRYAGLRLSEALALQPRDIEAGTVNVRHGKGDRQRVVGLNSAAVAHIDRWLVERERMGISRRAPLFCTFSKRGGRRHVVALSSRQVQLALKRRALRAGIEKRVHPHGLRHSCAVALVERGVAVPLVQRQLGHTNLGTTDVYLRGLGVSAHVDVVRDLDWSAGKS